MNLAIIGSGMIVQDLLANMPKDFRDEHHIHLGAIWGREQSMDKLCRLQESHQIDEVYTDYEELLKGPTDTVYIALPNHLHYAYAKKALKAGKNVILEKPFTLTYDSARELFEIAEANNCSIFEAISNQYAPNFGKIKEKISSLGRMRLMQANYSQYSSRYDRFKGGSLPDAFNPRIGGGALGDLNIYNIHLACGLFGRPDNVEYYPNLDRGCDTSGILILEYPDFKAVLSAAKDSASDSFMMIQGDAGEIVQPGPTNDSGEFTIRTRDGYHQRFDFSVGAFRLLPEFAFFADGGMQNYLSYQKMKQETLDAMWVLEEARKKANLLPAEEPDPFEA